MVDRGGDQGTRPPPQTNLLQWACLQVLWLPSDLRSLVQEMDPELQQTSGSLRPLEELRRDHIVKLNLHYSSMSSERIRSVSPILSRGHCPHLSCPEDTER